MQNLKKKMQMNLFTKQKQTHRHRKKLVVTSGGQIIEGWWGGEVRNIGGKIGSKDVLYSMGNIANIL